MMTYWKIEHSSSPAPRLGAVAYLAIVAAPAVLLVWIVPPRLFFPTLSLASFVIACGIALFAYRYKIDRRAPRISAWDIAAAFTAIWIVAGLLSDRKHIAQLFDYIATAP
jgi:hypothetical protein